MKKLINKIYISSLAIVLLIASGCSDNILDEIDTNPNSPTDVPYNELLPAVTIAAVYEITGGIAANGASLYAEHTSNVRLNPILPEDIEGFVWNNGYSALNDLNVMIGKAEDDNNPSYTGVGKVWFVYITSVLTDLYGDIPYSEALEGGAILQPRFDPQEDIYPQMLDLLDEAIADLEEPFEGNPGRYDLIFNGDKDMWIKAAYGLKARFWNRLSNEFPQQSAQEALAAIDLSFDEGEGFVFDGYLEGTVNDNPWAGQQKGQDLFAASTTILDVMDRFTDPGVNDPRKERWFTTIEGEYVGAPSGNLTDDTNHEIFSAPSKETVLYDEAPQPLLTYDELKFIEAEANLRLGNEAEANDAYEAAVVAALERAELDATEIVNYLSQGSVYPGEGNLTLEDIMLQKWLSFFMFQSIEAYNDVRRTGFPAMENPDGQPLRLPYPQSEVNRNPNTPQDINLVSIYTIPVWWDE